MTLYNFVNEMLGASRDSQVHNLLAPTIAKTSLLLSHPSTSHALVQVVHHVLFSSSPLPTTALHAPSQLLILLTLLPIKTGKSAYVAISLLSVPNNWIIYWRLWEPFMCCTSRTVARWKCTFCEAIPINLFIYLYYFINTLYMSFMTTMVDLVLHALDELPS